MLTFLSKPLANRMCDGLARRDFLRVGTLGLGGLTLADLLRLKARGAVRAEGSHKAVTMMTALWLPSARTAPRALSRSRSASVSPPSPSVPTRRKSRRARPSHIRFASGLLRKVNMANPQSGSGGFFQAGGQDVWGRIEFYHRA